MFTSRIVIMCLREKVRTMRKRKKFFFAISTLFCLEKEKKTFKFLNRIRFGISNIFV